MPKEPHADHDSAFRGENPAVRDGKARRSVVARDNEKEHKCNGSPRKMHSVCKFVEILCDERDGMNLMEGVEGIGYGRGSDAKESGGRIESLDQQLWSTGRDSTNMTIRQTTGVRNRREAKGFLLGTIMDLDVETGHQIHGHYWQAFDTTRKNYILLSTLYPHYSSSKQHRVKYNNYRKKNDQTQR